MNLQQFNKNTNISSLIKGLLNQIAIPSIKTIVNGDYILNGFFYIDKNDLLYCTGSGIYGDYATCIKISSYNFGTYYPQFTDRFLSTSNYYDSETHEWLGKYLRCVRDILEVNLMPLYNCFSNSFIDRFTIKSDGLIEEHNKEYKVAKIPVKFNTDYTIAIECDSTVMIAPVFMVKNKLLKVNLNGINLKNNNDDIITFSKLDTNDLTELLWERGNPIKTFLGTRFKQPIVFNITNADKEMRNQFQKYEDNLYMLIQLPKNNKSSIVVLEGDYTNCNAKRVFNLPDLHSFDREDMDNICASNLSLLLLNDGISRPFSNKLVEYLLLNPITTSEKIDKNIKRIQDVLNKDSIEGEYKYRPDYGTWTNELRYKIYKHIIDDKNADKLDIFGYVDKNSERILYRGE